MINVIAAALVVAYYQFGDNISLTASVLFNLALAANLHYRSLHPELIDHFHTIAASLPDRHIYHAIHLLVALWGKEPQRRTDVLGPPGNDKNLMMRLIESVVIPYSSLTVMRAFDFIRILATPNDEPLSDPIIALLCQ
jgi:hypothetical protein